MESMERLKKKIGDLGEYRKEIYSPKKAEFMNKYGDFLETKAETYGRYLEDKESFLQKETDRRTDIEEGIEGLEYLKKHDRGIQGMEELKKELKEEVKDLEKKIEDLGKSYRKILVLEDDIEEERDKLKKNLEKLNKLESDASPKDNRLSAKLKDRIEESGLNIESHENELEKLKAQNIKKDFDQAWEDLWAAQKDTGRFKDYKTLEEAQEAEIARSRRESWEYKAVKEQFEGLENSGATVESIKEASEQAIGTISKFYDKQEQLNKLVRRWHKYQLAGELIAGSVQATFNTLKSKLKIGDRRETSENLSLGLFRAHYAARAIFTKKEGFEDILYNKLGIPSMQEIQKWAEKYRKHAPEIKEDTEDSPEVVEAIVADEVNEEVAELEQGDAEAVEEEDDAEAAVEAAENEGMAIPAESTPEPEINISEKVSNKIFEGMSKAYGKYLESGSEDEKGVNALFKAMKKAKLDPEVIKKEGVYYKRWMAKIQTWYKDIEKLDRNDIRQRMSNNHWDYLIKIHSVENWKKTGLVRDLVGNMFKSFLLTKKLTALEK